MASSLMERVADHLHGFTYNGKRWVWEWYYPGYFSWHGHDGTLLTAEFEGNPGGDPQGFSLVFQAMRDGEFIQSHIVDFTNLRDKSPRQLADYVVRAAKGVASDIMRGRYVIRTNPFVPYP